MKRKKCRYVKIKGDKKGESMVIDLLKDNRYIFHCDTIYSETNYDPVGWLISKDKFNWEKHSWVVPIYCPWNFNKNRYNWRDYSYNVIQKCPHLFDEELYNWDSDSRYVARYCIDKFNPHLYNFHKDGWMLKIYHPDKVVLFRQ